MSRVSVVAFAIALGPVLLPATGCMRVLPENDLRITAATPTIKISADILWKEYLDNAREADKKYWSQAILVTGQVTTIVSEAPQAFLMTQAANHGIRLQLLDDQAAATMEGVTPGQKLTLKCFCAGFKDDVQLKSCVRP